MSRLAIVTNLIVAPLAWAVSVQLGQVLPYVDCGRRTDVSAIAAAVCAVVALGVGLLSFQGVAEVDAAEGRTLRFVATLGVLLSLVFVFALILQVAAGVVLTGCER